MVQLKYDWVIRLFLDISSIFIFLFIFLHPLWKLSKNRRSMIIMFSRAFGSIFRLLSDMPDFLLYNILYVEPSPIVNYLHKSNRTFTDCVLATHILALAVNRAHSIIFPFHYNWFSAKKSNFYLICSLLWLYSLIIGALDLGVWRWSGYRIDPFLITHKICMGIGAICYVALGCQMMWLKYKKNPTLSNGSSTAEKDQFRISIVCFSCLFMSSLRYLVISPIDSTSWEFVPRLIMTWLSVVTNLLTVCTEEICLLFLVRDFRKDVKHQFKSIFCYFAKNQSSTNNITTIVTFSSKNNTQINNWKERK